MAVGIIAAIFAYGALGTLVAIPMVLRGVNRLDPAADDGTWGFRLLAIPGVMVLWPLVLIRWAKAGRS